LTFHICASPDYLKHHGTPQTPEEIKTHNCLLFPRAEFSFDWLFKNSDGEITRIPINGKYLITNSAAIKQCAVAAMGLALLPDWLVNDDINSGKLVKLFPEYAVTATDYESAVWILYPSREYTPLKTRVFIDFLTQRFASLGRNVTVK